MWSHGYRFDSRAAGEHVSGGADGFRAAQAGLETVVKEMARRRAVPAGGAAAASAVAQGAALLAKCARIAAGSGVEMPSIAALDALAADAVEAFATDCEAFVAVLTAKRSETGARGEAWVRATTAPLELAATALDALERVGTVGASAKKATLPDVEAAAMLLSTGLAIALENARVNLAWVPAARRPALGARLRELEVVASKHRPRVVASVQRQLTEAIREACARAASDAYRDAGYAGLCEDGRFELMIDSIRNASLDAVAPHGVEIQKPAAPRGD